MNIQQINLSDAILLFDMLLSIARHSDCRVVCQWEATVFEGSNIMFRPPEEFKKCLLCTNKTADAATTSTRKELLSFSLSANCAKKDNFKL